MSLPSPKSEKIAGAFERFTRTGDKTEIQEFSREEVELALVQYYRDKGGRHYIAMEKRVEELKDLERLQFIKRERWKERGIGIVIGIFVTVVSGIILYWIIKPNK